MTAASGAPRLRPGTRVRIRVRYLTQPPAGSRVAFPVAMIDGAGTILRGLSGKVEAYSWEVAVDGIDPGPSGFGNRYTYAEYELEPL